MKIGINGSGSTARSIIKLLAKDEEFKDLEIAHINGKSMTLEVLRDRLLYSTAHGHSLLKIETNLEKNQIIINGKKITYTQETDPERIPWESEIEIVLEATGKFNDNTKESANPFKHFKAPNNKLRGLIITAPGKGDIKDLMFIGSPNLEEEIKAITSKKEPFVIAGASCTTTAAIPIIDTLDSNFGIESCYLSTIHAVTRSQEILDGAKGWSGTVTQLHSTGATKSTNKVLKKNIPMDGIAYRTIDKTGSFIQIDAVLKNTTTKENILEALKKSKYSKYISWSDVNSPPSSYVIGDKNMVMLIPNEISLIDNKRVIIRGLYDNEDGYAGHLLRLVQFVSKHL